MRTLLATILCTMLVAAVGCKSNDHDHHNGKMKKGDMSMDMCPHCPGVQHLKADGTCEKCGMKMKAAANTNAEKMAAKGTNDVDTKAHSAAGAADVCAKCPGVQTAKADGTCSGCGAKLAAAGAADVCAKCPGVQTAKADGTCSGCGAKLAAGAYPK